jgi:hypothetical protein
MARIKTRTLFWDASPSTDVVGYAVYAEPAGDTTFVSRVDAGSVTPLFPNVAETSVVLTDGVIAEGDWQFAVCAQDDAGNFSDPYQNAAWVNVPLDITAPAAPTNGGVN